MCVIFFVVSASKKGGFLYGAVYEKLGDEFKIQSNTTNTTTNNIRIYIFHIHHTTTNNDNIIYHHTQKNYIFLSNPSMSYFSGSII